MKNNSCIFMIQKTEIKRECQSPKTSRQKINKKVSYENKI
jgi:hypothetical protein